MEALRNLWNIARHQGVGAAVGTIRHRASERYWEWRFNAQTTGAVESAELGFSDPACRMYVPTDYGTLFHLLRRLGPDIEREVFIDYGSGKGRVLLAAATRPFKRVIGVELSAALCDVAEKNIERARRVLRCPDIEVVACGADVFEVPADASVAFFWNPFTDAILDRVMENLRASLQAHSRRLRLIAVFAAGSDFEAQFKSYTWLRTIEDGARGERSYRIAEGMETRHHSTLSS